MRDTKECLFLETRADFDELLFRLEVGIEVNLMLDGTLYLLENRGEGVMIATCPDGDPVAYDSWDELMQRYEVGGKPIGERWREFQIIAM